MSTGMRCDEQYGQNPDKCYLQFNHRGPHSNRYGTTWEQPSYRLPRPAERVGQATTEEDQ